MADLDLLEGVRLRCAAVVRAVIAATQFIQPGTGDDSIQADAAAAGARLALLDAVGEARRDLDTFVKSNAVYAPGTEVGLAADQLGRLSTLVGYTSSSICDEISENGNSSDAAQLETLRARLSSEIKQIMDLAPKAFRSR